MDKNIADQHESYGMLELSRHRRPATALYGSSIKHENTIRLRVAPAQTYRKHNTDYVYAAVSPMDAYVDVEMSYAQFAEAITSLNMGAGVPVTVRYANGRKMAPCPFVSKDEQFRSEFEADLAGLAETADRAVSFAESLLSGKKPLNKSEKEELLSMLRAMSQDVRSNIPFVRECFTEQMDKTLTEAKSNFEGFVQNRLNEIASAAIAQSIKSVVNGAPALMGFINDSDSDVSEGTGENE